jgi:hypothetical protein
MSTSAHLTVAFRCIETRFKGRLCRRLDVTWTGVTDINSLSSSLPLQSPLIKCIGGGIGHAAGRLVGVWLAIATTSTVTPTNVTREIGSYLRLRVSHPTPSPHRPVRDFRLGSLLAFRAEKPPPASSTVFSVHVHTIWTSSAPSNLDFGAAPGPTTAPTP